MPMSSDHKVDELDIDETGVKMYKLMKVLLFKDPKFSKLCTSVGCLPVKQVKIKLKCNAVSYQTPARWVPITLQEKIKDGIKSMEKQGIISKLDHNTPTEWLNSYIIIKKPNRSLHICLDPTRLNEYILRPVCNSATLDEVSNS